MTRDTSERLRRTGNEMVSFGACWPTTTVGAMVNLTRIYTRTGDGGETRLGDMSVTTKTDTRLHAYADVDEANAQLGVALAQGDLEEDVRAVLIHVQNDLFDVGADFWPRPSWPTRSTRRCGSSRTTSTGSRAGATTTTRICRPCARSSSTAARSARPTSTSRAPSYAARSGPAWAAHAEHGETMNLLAIKYLNRLSDLLFILARYANREQGDVLWVPGGERTAANRAEGEGAEG